MKQLLTDIFKTAIHETFGEAATNCDPMIQLSSRKEFGDYQANFAMRLSKQLNQKPFDVATEVIQKLNNLIINYKLYDSILQIKNVPKDKILSFCYEKGLIDILQNYYQHNISFIIFDRAIDRASENGHK